MRYARAIVATLLTFAALAAPAVALAASWSTPGTYSWFAIPGIFSATVTVVGGGGGSGGSWFNGDAAGGAGGGAGGYYRNYTYSIAPGSTYTIVVGAGGAGGAHTSCGSSGGCGPGVGSAGGSSSFGGLAATGGGGGSYGGAGYYGGGGAGGTPQQGPGHICDGYVGTRGVYNGLNIADFCPPGEGSTWYSCAATPGGTNGSGYGSGGSFPGGCTNTGAPGGSGLVSITLNDSCPTYAWEPWNNGIYVIEPGATRKVYDTRFSSSGYCVTNYSSHYVVIGGGGGDAAGQLSTFHSYAGNAGATVF